MKLVIGADHAGFEYKELLKKYLTEKNLTVTDKGTYSKDSVDYPDFAHPVAGAIENKEAEFGILICGSANGVAITANRHHGVRAAICWNNEVAELARKHNNANIICIPARFVGIDLAKCMTDIFLETSFEHGRHERRMEKIEC